jgi:uncharacterized membrane protein
MTLKPRKRVSFSEDFRRFFQRGLAALLPTLITLWLLIWVWNFLWQSLGVHLIWVVKYLQYNLGGPDAQWGNVDRMWELRTPVWIKQFVGVALAFVLVYVVGLFVGNLIGRTFWRMGEKLALKIPIIRAIYPAVKQVTDFLLQERAQLQFSRVVAVQPHASNIWSIGLVTGAGLRPLHDATGAEMVTVFVPSSPTAFSGYVLVVPRESVVELPLTVEEAMRLLVSGGVINPLDRATLPENASTI